MLGFSELAVVSATWLIRKESTPERSKGEANPQFLSRLVSSSISCNLKRPLVVLFLGFFLDTALQGFKWAIIIAVAVSAQTDFDVVFRKRKMKKKNLRSGLTESFIPFGRRILRRKVRGEEVHNDQ